MDDGRTLLTRLPGHFGSSSSTVSAIHRWSGEYVGFLSGGWFFDGNGRYLGWVADGKAVWRADGNWLGELIESCYVLRKVACPAPVRRTPRVPPVPRPPPERPKAKLPRQPRPGWTDALEEVARLPTAGELVGRWCHGESSVEFDEWGRFLWSSESGVETGGEWRVTGPTLAFRSDRESEWTTYAVLEYAPTALTLREISATGRTLVLVLLREADGPGGRANLRGGVL